MGSLNKEYVAKALSCEHRFADSNDDRMAQIERLETALSSAADLNDCAERLSSLTEKTFHVIDKLLTEAEDFGSFMLDVEGEEAYSNVHEFYLSCAQLINNMYRKLVLADRYRKIFSDDRNESKAKIFAIKAEIVGENIMIQAPLLASQWGNKSISRDGFFRYGQTFSVEIEEEVYKLLASTDAEFLKRFSSKTLNYFFNYPSSVRKISDADNKDTKAITDAITRHFPGGDSPLSCSFSYENIRNDDLPAATFIVVSPGKGHHKNADCLKDFSPLRC